MKWFRSKFKIRETDYTVTFHNIFKIEKQNVAKYGLDRLLLF